MVVALEFDCPACGRKTPSGVITDKQTLQFASRIRVRCTHCNVEFHVKTRDIELADGDE